jgi:polyisoprenoid-binding protein YceI
METDELKRTTMSISTPQPTGTKSTDRTRWRIDPARSQVEFRTPTLWGLTTVKGRFERYDGTLDLWDQPTIELTIDAASLDTNNSRRDRHLRSGDFFDVENHPEVHFVSDSVVLTGDRLAVAGRLYAAGTSLPLQFDAKLRRVDDELEVDARTHADHLELGMSHGILGMIRGSSELIVRGRLVKDAA